MNRDSRSILWKIIGLMGLFTMAVSCASEKQMAPLKVEACTLRFHGMNANVGFLTYLKYELKTDKQGKVGKIAPLYNDQGQKAIFTYEEFMACLKHWELAPNETYTLNMDLTNNQPLVWDLRLDGKLVLSLTWDDKCNRPIPSMMRSEMPPPPDAK